jgi:hypothetical protein
MRTEALEKLSVLDDADLSGLPRRELEAMAGAGEEVVECLRVLSKTDDNVVGELLRDHGTFFEWDHYPPGDVYDRETHAQYYYHAHAPNERFPGEHGHFHTFLRPRGMPIGVKPAPVPGYKPPKDPNDALSHLIAVAMDKHGLPMRLFTVNRWVTGEVWYEAEDVIRMLDYFVIDHARPSWPANRWITALVRLYRPQIVKLVRARDRVVADWQTQHPTRDVYEDRDLEVTSVMDVDIDTQLQRINTALQAQSA